MTKYEGTQSIARTFQLIKLFDDQHPSWSLADLVKASGLKRTTTFRILAALEAEGIVRKTETGDYTLGSELIALGGRAIRANQLRMVARPYMQALSHKTTESVTIDALWGDEAGHPTSMVIEEVLGQRLLGLSQYIGARFPAHTTSTGKVFLAYLPDGTYTHLNLTSLTAPTPHTLTSPETLQQELVQIRKQGFATTTNELEMGLAAVAAPIFDHHGEVKAALCIAGPSSRFGPEKLHALAEQLIQSATEISQEIGYRP